MIIIVLVVLIVFILGLIVGRLYLRQKYLETKVNEQIKDKVVLSIAVPRNNDKTPLAAEQLFAALHGIGLNKGKSADHFSLEIAAGNYGIYFICVISKQYKTFVENQIYAQYPEAQITEIQDYSPGLTQANGNIAIAELGLVKDPYLPIRTFSSFDVDPLAGITGALANLPLGTEVFLQILARPLADSWQKVGKDKVAEMKGKVDAEGKKIALDSGETDTVKLIETKNSKVGYQFKIRILAKSTDQTSSQRMINEVIAAFGQYRTAVFNSIGKPPAGPKGWEKFKADIAQSIHFTFIGKRLGDSLTILEKFTTRFLDEFTKDIVNTEELASLYHLPNKSVETPNISWARSKKLEYPLDIPTKDSRIIGLTDYRGIHLPFGIKPLDRLRHMYVIGKTGMGKSTFMEGLITADIYEGNGVGVIDPHGETIEHILTMIPEHRMDDVIVFDPGDIEYPVGFNLLEVREGDDRSLIADSIVSVFKKEFENSWGPRLEYILTNAILTLLHCQNVSLMVLPRLLSDDNYRTFLLKQVKDPIILKFWNEEYAQIAKDPRRKSEEISSILNKVGRFTTNPMIRNIIGQITSSIDIRRSMDDGKILLINLSQGKVGEENMKLLGGMLITRLFSSAIQRTNPSQRRPFYLYVDEFQNFSNSTFVKILSEARKYGLALTVAHQFIDQIDPDILNAIFGNVGSILNFAVGPKDAAVLVQEYAPYLEAEDLVNLGKHKVVTKISIDLAQSKPFTAQTTKPNFPETGLRDKMIEVSRAKYAKPRDVISQKIFKWAEQTYNKEGNLYQKEQMSNQPDREKQPEKPAENAQSTEQTPAPSPAQPQNNDQKPEQNQGGNRNRDRNRNRNRHGNKGGNNQQPQPQNNPSA